jgi:uncharacterized coiled-coil protein SlyX
MTEIKLRKRAGMPGAAADDRVEELEVQLKEKEEVIVELRQKIYVQEQEMRRRFTQLGIYCDKLSRVKDEMEQEYEQQDEQE